ncbi:MAG: carboxypeptidase regulatory-like domain-containing protein, partial [Thermoplasmatota archaeon]
MRLSWPNILTSKEKPQSTEASKIEKHWGTIVSLIGIFLLALFIRSYFAFDLATKFGAPYLLSGGSDAYYYQRIIDYIQSNHHHMLTDPLRKYPLGGLNPRPPLLAWTSVLTGYAISPFVGDVSEAISYSFIFSAGIWGALTVFPAYLIGRDTFGKKAGIAGALMLAISSGHLQRSVITNGDHDALYLFFAVTAFYFFMKALESIPEDINWVSDWSDPDEIKKGLINFASKNKVSLLNAAMAGMSTAAVALTWKGFPYVMVIILVYFFFQLIVNKLQVKDSLGITSVVGVSMGMTFLVAGPYYIGTGFGSDLPSGIGKWYDVPLIIFLAAFLIGVFFTVTRDVPWLLVFSSFFTAIALFFALGSVFFPGLIDTLMGGAGYFVQNKLYSTIAEAQAPQFSNLVLSFGLVSFFLSITGLIFAIWHLKSDLRPNFMFILIWTGFAIYMAVTAARFIFNSSPAFALLAGWVLALAVDKVDFPGIYQRFRVYRGDMFRGIYEGVKLKHIMVALLVVFLVVMPNTLYAFDAGIPYEEKIEYDNDIYETLPKAIRPEGHDPDSDNNWYLGAFGYSMDKPTGYWPAAWDWFSEQDSELPPEERPAFVSWWDYGFEAMQEGQHPTVADNFQQGYRIAGNILMAQNESETIALFIARELELPYSKDGGFEGRVRDILVEHIGEDKTAELEDVYRNPAAYKEEVLSNPKRYHPRAEDIHPRNVWCAKVMGLLSYEGVDTLSELYRDVSLHLDKRIKYLAVDSRLFPTSGTQTGIFYAPAKLSGHRVDESEGMRTPVDFFDILLAGDDGNSYEDPDNIPQGVSITNYKIDFKPMFYNTTLYRTFAGYSADEVDKGKGGNGIPGLGEQNQIMPMPSWNMSHFRMAYKTAYYNPYPQDEVRNHSDAWRAVSFETASKYQEQEKGTVDMSPRSYMNQGVVFLEYFDGAIVSGNVETENGDPIEDATITVLDESGTPHQTRKTDGDGYYKVKVPFGNISVIASNGGISGGNKIIKTEAIQLGSVSLNVTKDEAMRKKVDKNVDGKWDYLYDRDITVSSSDLTVNVFIDQDQDGSYNQANDTLVSSEVTVVNEDSGVEYDSGMTNGTYTFENLVPGTYKISSDAEGTEELTGVKVEPGEDISEGVMVTTGSISGGVESEVENGEETFDIKIEREDTDYNATTTVEAGDNYTFEDLVPGTYYIDIDNDSYTVDGGPYYFDIGDEDEKEHNITVIDSTVVEGKTIYSSKKLPYQRLTFEGGSGVNYSRVIRTDEDGEFRIKLPLGKFIV